MIYTSKVIIIQHYHDNHRNIIDGKHGNGTQPNKNLKAFRKQYVPAERNVYQRKHEIMGVGQGNIENSIHHRLLLL